MGMNVIPLKELTPDEPKVLTLELLKNMDPNDVQNEKSRGQIVIEALYKPFKDSEIPKDIDEDSNEVQKAPEGTPAGGGLLVIIVHEAQDVEGKHHTNPYVRLLFRGEERKTKVYFNPSIVKLVGSHNSEARYILLQCPHTSMIFPPCYERPCSFSCNLLLMLQSIMNDDKEVILENIKLHPLLNPTMNKFQQHCEGLFLGVMNSSSSSLYSFCIDFKFGILMQYVKKNRDPRWEEEFSFTLEEPPTNDRIHVEVISTSSRMGLLHPKVQLHLFFNLTNTYFDSVVSILNQTGIKPSSYHIQNSEN